MEKTLEECLKTLNSEQCLRKPRVASLVLDKICQCFTQEQSQFTLGLLIGLALDEKDSIFSFIWRTCNETETIPAVTSSFRVLEILVNDFKKSTEPYFDLLYKNCVDLLETNYAKTKDLSLRLIRSLLEIESGMSYNLDELVQKLKKLMKDCRKTGTVIEQVCRFVGYLCDKHPENVKVDSSFFFCNFCNIIENEMSITKNPSTAKIRGAFEGINGYLVNYTPTDFEKVRKIYECMKKFSKFKQDKRAVGQVVLKILHNHWTHFSKFVFDDRDTWKENLSVWLTQGPEDRESGFLAFHGFCSVIALFINQNPSRSHILKNFVEDFKNVVNSKTSNSHEKLSALVGAKLFVLTECLQGGDQEELYRAIINFTRIQESASNFTLLPLCVECISAFMFKLPPSETFEQLSYLEKLSVMLIDSYPRISSRERFNALIALEKSFYFLGICDLQTMRIYLGKVLYQALIRVCSLTTVEEVEALKEEQPEVEGTSYKSYLEVWRYLLNLAGSSNFPVGGSFMIKKGVAAKVFDSAVESFLKVITKLNLDVSVKRHGEEMNVAVKNASDFRIFINAVGLYEDLMPLVDTFALTKHLPEIFRVMTYLSDKHPLVAGFYKIIATTLKISEKLQFFQGEGKCCFDLLLKYLEDVLLKVNQFKGELQIACLQTLLAAPAFLVEPFAEKTTSALEIVVQLGRSNFPLLKGLIETLELWHQHLPPASSHAIMKKILPHFDLFFQSQFFQGNNLVASSIIGKKLKKKLIFNDSEFLALQKRFLLFLGDMEISQTLYLVQQPDTGDERKVNDKNLLYSPPTSTYKIEIHLNDILPKIMDLAVSCSDRKTRITACELLYSTVMITLSNVSQSNGGYSFLFRKMIRTCLTLGSDSDSVVYQIFEPLMFQITHYFAGKNPKDCTESQDVMDILMEAVTRPYDPATRDFAAFLILEFTEWSIKQHSTENPCVTPQSVIKIIENIISLSLNPNYYKRLGAAVVFNKIYCLLREEDIILDSKWFDLYYYFVESLRLCEESEDVTEIIQAIQHVKRPLIERHEEFNEISSLRNFPTDFEGELLSDLVKWTMKWCSDVKTPTRRLAMAMVKELAPYVRDCGSLKSFASLHLPGRLVLVNMKFVDSVTFTEDYIVDWLKHQCALFEYCTFLLQENIVASSVLGVSESNQISANYIKVFTSKTEKTHRVEMWKRESALLFLKLMNELKDRAFYFPEEFWGILKILVFCPTQAGFDVNLSTTSEDLLPILINLLSYLSVNLTHYNWDLFYSNLENIIEVPVLHYITRNRLIDVKSSEFLFSLKVIENSGIWEEFVKRTMFSMDGGLIMEIIFRSLFAKKGTNTYALSLEPSCKLYLEELMKVGLKVGVGVDDLLNFMEDCTAVKEEETGSTISKGKYFQLQFKDTLYEVLKTQSSAFIDIIVKRNTVESLELLVYILDNQTHEDDIRLSREVFSRWVDLKNIKEEKSKGKNKKMILSQLAMNAFKTIGTPMDLKKTPIAEFIFECLELQNLKEMEDDEFKVLCTLLPILSDFEEKETDNPRLENGLTKFLVKSEVLVCHALEGPQLETKLRLIFSGMLKSLRLTGSLSLYRFMLALALRFLSLSDKKELGEAIAIFSDMPSNHSETALNLTYIALNSQKSSWDIQFVYEWFMEPLLKVVPGEAFSHFVVSNLENLCDSVSTDLSLRESTVGKTKLAISRKIVDAKILQIYLTRTPKTKFENLASSKKSIFVKIVKNCFQYLKKPFSKIYDLKDDFFRFTCETFNLICTIVTSCCSEEKFYRFFIFPEKNSFLYDIIDESSVYFHDLPMDFDEVPKKKKIQTLLKNPPTSETPTGRSYQKLTQTKTLFSSSLREDVTKFDLSSASIRPLDSVQDPSEAMEVELEMDAFNCHKCMPTIVGVITKMVVEKISPISDQDSDKLPSWLKFFVASLKNPSLSDKFKLFALKVLYNVQEFLKPFKAKIFPHVLESVSKLFSNLNYFCIDLIEIMIDWEVLPVTEESQLQLYRLLKMFISNSDSFKSGVINNNIKIIKRMLEVWKDFLSSSELSEFVMTRLIRSSGAGPAALHLNIKICWVFLRNGIPSWKLGSELNFFEFLMKHFRNENKDRKIFAEVCGLALSLLEKTGGRYEECLSVVKNKIDFPTCWLQLLHTVHQYHPKISETFFNRIYTSAWDSSDSFLAEKLEMMLYYISNSEEVDDGFKRNGHFFLVDMLNSADIAVQQLSLQITIKMLGRFNEDKNILLIKEAYRYLRSTDDNVRKYVYEIAVKLYPESQNNVDLRKTCKIILLKGLNDSATELEEFCLKFWQDFLKLSSLSTAFIKVFEEMYTPETEDIFLSNTAKLLLRSAASSHLCQKPIMPYPLVHQSKFQKRELVLKSRTASISGFMSSKITGNQSLERITTLASKDFQCLKSLDSLKFAPTMLKGEKTSTQIENAALEKPKIPRPPYKQRFYRNAEKISMSFALRQSQKKKKDLEKEEFQKKKKDEVEIFGEYRAGDFPDIEISHFQVLKPLESLANKDNQTARLFLVSLFSGIIESASPDEKKSLLSKTEEIFEKILGTSTNFDPGVFGFVLQVILKHCDDFDIDCKLICNAAVSSNWLLLGALILEGMIAKHEETEGVKTKRQKGRETEAEFKWLELAKLYRSLEEFDVVSGIFLDKLKIEGPAKNAVLSESFLDWAAASSHYEDAIKADGESSLNEFYTESYFSCLSKLSSWTQMNECIRKTVDGDMELIWKNCNLLFWFLKSEMMVSLGSHKNDLKTSLEKFCENKSKMNILSTNFGGELAVFDWLSGKLQKANYRIDRLCLDFLAGWSHLNQWCHNLRVSKLADLQTVSELSFAVKTLAERDKTKMEESIKTAEKKWRKNVPTACDDLTIWDVKLSYRREFLKQCRDFDMKLSEVKSNLTLAKVALMQDNLSLTKECLSRVKTMLPEVDTESKAEYTYYFNLGKLTVIKTKTKNENDCLKMYLNVWRGISKHVTATMETDSEVTQNELLRYHFILGEVVSSIVPFVIRPNVSPEVLHSVSEWVGDSPGNLQERLKKKSLEYFEATKDIAESLGDASAKSNAYLQLTKTLLNFNTDYEKLGRYLLRAMSLGNAEARVLFGCLLTHSQIETKNSYLDGFIKESDAVPSWMFLVWINQILASLGTRLFPFLKIIVSRIARDYPNALRYPFRLSKESYNKKNAELQAFVSELNTLLLSDKLRENFFIAMTYLGPPDMILIYHLEKVLNEVKQESPNYLRIRSKLTELYNFMYGPDFDVFRGSIFSFWNIFKKSMKLLLSFEGSREDLKNELQALLASVKSSKLPSERSFRVLGSYSPWLRNFHALKEEDYLEIPGQYDGNQKPVMKYIATVSYFKNEVIVIDSKCKPMKLGILGNDAIEYNFLIKFGEDLRQDERIQQLFKHLNQSLRENKLTVSFSVEGFKVIPLTHSLGMIEWIDNNASLHEVIESTLGNNIALLKKAQDDHVKFLGQGSPLVLDSAVAAHLLAYESIARDVAISNFNFRVQQFPRDIIKKSFWSLASSPEHFVCLKRNFAVSHAAMSITHWLVGIGDRHLQNILVSTKTGRVLGIDFGYAFGFATQCLTPPELVPFRLTPQILYLLYPLEESGWIKQTMTHCLRVFRKEQRRVLSVLEVFAREPVIDWVEQALNSERCKSEESEIWQPKQKISMVREKLTGVNPVVSFEADLNKGHSKSRFLIKYLEVLRGVEQQNFRARCKRQELTEEEQVECLIDLATDRHVLAKTYVGWNPWL